MYHRMVIVAALGIAAMITFVGCGGDENSPPDPDDQPQVSPPLTCRVKADCPNQSADAGIEDSQVPDAGGIECFNLNDRLCGGEGMNPCTWVALNEPCSFECQLDDGRVPYAANNPAQVLAYAQACGFVEE